MFRWVGDCRWRQATEVATRKHEAGAACWRRSAPSGCRAMAEGHLHALAITASSYGSGLHVTFYDSLGPIVPWTRSQRLAVRTKIAVPHLLASSAIPFVFPAVALDIDGRLEYCGDGSMRQAAPISPAVHLGAERILVVGAGRMHEPPGERAGSSEYPNLAQIAGHALSSIFLDALRRFERRSASTRPSRCSRPSACGHHADAERVVVIARGAARRHRIAPSRHRPCDQGQPAASACPAAGDGAARRWPATCSSRPLHARVIALACATRWRAATR